VPAEPKPIAVAAMTAASLDTLMSFSPLSLFALFGGAGMPAAS
jgi:hypothetical protein